MRHCCLAAVGMLLWSESAIAEDALLPRHQIEMRIDAVEDVRVRLAHHEWSDSDDPNIVQWRNQIDQYRGESPEQQANAVNLLVNQDIQYLDDWDDYSLRDYWALLSETLARGHGDCEDFALAKLESLAYLGWSEEHLALAVGELEYHGRQVAHAVAVVRVDDSGDPMVLGNIDAAVERLSARDDFAPAYVAAIDPGGAEWVFLENLPHDQ